MCDPATLLAVGGFATSALSSVTAYVAKGQVADAQNQQWKQNYTNSLAAARSDQDQTTLRQSQEQDAYTQKVSQSEVDTAQRAAETQVAGAQGGVSGISLGNLITDVNRKGAMNQLDATKNFEDTAAQLQAQKDATNNTAVSRINSVQQGVQPSGLALATDIGSAGIKGFAGYQKATSNNAA